MSEIRKVKSSVFSGLLKKSRSKSGLRADSASAEHPSLHAPPPLPDTHASFLPIPGPSTKPAMTPAFPAVLKKRGKRDKHSAPAPLTPSPKSMEDEFTLDTNLESMDGIVDMRLHSLSNDPSSPSSGYQSSSHGHISDQSSFYQSYNPPLSSVEFINPFLPTRTVDKRKAIISPKGFGKIAPTTKLPPNLSIRHSGHMTGRLPSGPNGTGEPGSPTGMHVETWIPPESWAVEKVGEDAAEGESSSSEDSISGGVTGRRIAVNGDHPPHSGIAHFSNGAHLHPTNTPSHKSRKKHKTGKTRPTPEKPFQIRIYRANNTFHIATLTPHVNVANLTPALNEKLLLGADVETHRLYLKERGRGRSFFVFVPSLLADETNIERILAQTERPADIVRRRLEQAGYDPVDGIELLGGDLSFLLKFVYKSQLLGPAVRPLSFYNLGIILTHLI